FDILQAMPFFRRGPKRFGKHLKFVRFYCRLTRLGQKTWPLNADKIAQIDQLENLHRLGAKLFLLEVGLNPPGCVAKINEMALAHIAMGRDAARRPKQVAFLELFQDFSDRARSLECAAKRFDAPRTKGGEFFATLDDQFVLRFHRSRLWNAKFTRSARSLPQRHGTFRMRWRRVVRHSALASLVCQCEIDRLRSLQLHFLKWHSIYQKRVRSATDRWLNSSPSSWPTKSARCTTF